MLNTVIHGRWEDWLPQVPSGSVDMVLLDPPYNTTACEWDKQPVDLAALWKELKRVGKPNAAYVFTASQPFTTDLINSNRAWFKYCWVWDKVNLFTNQMNAKKMPMKQHEDICIFGKGNVTYNPQFRKGKPYKGRGLGTIEVFSVKRLDGENLNSQMYPGTIISIPGMGNEKLGLHPTEKICSLFSYLIRTYSNLGDTVLDCFAGSFTTAEACIITGRNFITIEQDEKYCQVGRERIARLQMQPSFSEMVG